jgi:uncharacterized protein YecT (DUF1311 family)
MELKDISEQHKVQLKSLMALDLGSSWMTNILRRCGIKNKNMRIQLLIVLCFSYLSIFSQSQAEMNEKANEAFKKADKELNEIYKTILTDYKSDTLFIKNLKSSQRIWITFRDTELKVKYPETEAGYYGCVYPMCVSIYLEQLTLDRIKTLKVWIDGIEEGDVCTGSVKTKEK